MRHHLPHQRKIRYSNKVEFSINLLALESPIGFRTIEIGHILGSWA
jgi:hypothetical protein